MSAPTAAHRRRWSAIVDFGCIVTVIGLTHACSYRRTIHHCFTGGGGRKEHDKTICLCWNMHLGEEGIDGGRLSKRQWQTKYASETELLEKTEELLCPTKDDAHTVSVRA